MGVFQSPNNSAVMGSASAARLGVTSAMLTITRNTGQLTGIAVLGAIWALRVSATVRCDNRCSECTACGPGGRALRRGWIRQHGAGRHRACAFALGTVRGTPQPGARRSEATQPFGQESVEAVCIQRHHDLRIR